MYILKIHLDIETLIIALVFYWLFQNNRKHTTVFSFTFHCVAG